MGVEETDMMFKEIKSNFSLLKQMTIYHLTSIKKLKTQMGLVWSHLDIRPKG